MPLPDEPNVTLPLATSVTERGIAGYTHSVTNSEDARKLNCIYEPVKNPMTGKGSLDLVKRPGVTKESIFMYGSSSQTPYLIATQLTGGVNTFPIVFSTVSSGANVTASIPTQTTVVAAAVGGYTPGYVDKTNIANLDTLVLQLINSPASVQRVFYSSDQLNITWTEIIDADFTGLLHRGKMEHMDGFAFVLAGATNRIYNSDINSLANWSATSFLAKQIQQDYSVGLARYKNQLLAFGDSTVEIFYNAGNTVGSPLGRIPQLSDRVGLVATTYDEGTHYYASTPGELYFVGRRGGGVNSIGVFAYDGSSFSKVSSLYIDKILGEKSTTLYSVNSIGINGQVGIAIGLTLSSASTQRWLIYFPDWKEWFEWTSTIFSPINNGSWFLGISSGNTNRVYSFTASDNWQDDGTSYAWSTQFKVPSKGSSRNVLNMYGVDADTARSANNLTVEISRDDCATFETLGTIDLTQDRKVLFRGGAFRNAHIRLGNTNAVETRIHSFLARVNG